MSSRNVKVCLLGDTAVGKTSIVLRFVADKYDGLIPSTMGASFFTQTMVVGENILQLQIWDTAGQERYRSLAPMYYRGAAVAIIVYDITCEESFYSMQRWVEEVEKYGPSQLVILIAGNKCDLKNKQQVKTEDAKEYAQEIGADFFETSAKTSSNITELFHSIANRLPPEKWDDSLENSLRKTVKFNNNINERRNCCSRSRQDKKDRSSLHQIDHRSRAVPRMDGYISALSSTDY